MEAMLPEEDGFVAAQLSLQPQLPTYENQHVNPQGPGDARPTAMQIIHDNAEAAESFSDKVILITGCSSGIGVETARALYVTGAKLFITVRDVAKGRKVIDDIIESTRNIATRKAQEIELIVMHMDRLDAVREAACQIETKTDRLNVIINNAGVMATPYTRTEDGYELQFAVNHLAHFLLVHKLLPLLLRSSTSVYQSRVINLTSVGHRSSSVQLDDLKLRKPGRIDNEDSNAGSDRYNPFIAYSQSKTANIWFANELERRYGKRGLHGLAVHPGAISTSLSRHMSESTLQSFASPMLKSNAKSVEQGAATTVWAVVAESLEGRGGLYLENCKVSGPAPAGASEMGDIFAEGYAAHAFDPEGERRLWLLSCEMANIKEPLYDCIVL